MRSRVGDQAGPDCTGGEPGDVITTGTPSGVGCAMNPPRFLRPGDVVKIEIERIGSIENRVIEEPPETACM